MDDSTTHSPPDEREPISHDLFCQSCAYNLRGLTGERCPECGSSLDSVRSEVSGIPWVHRDELGRFRAYWKTVWHVMFRQRRFCDEMARPVSYADSQRFRWVTLLHAYIPVLLGTLAMFTYASPGTHNSGLVDRAFANVWPVVVVHLGLLLFLAAATGLPSYFFHPSDLPVTLQNRAVAMSYYACGPLAVTALPVATAIVGIVGGLNTRWAMGLLLFAILFPAAQIVVCWTDLVHIARRIMPQQRVRIALIAMLLPVLGVTLAGLIFVGVPLVALFLWLVYASLNQG